MKYPEDFINKIICGDCLEVMKEMPDGCVDMCLTSPPYWGLRDYGVEQIFGGDLGCEHEWNEHSRYWDNRAASLLAKEGTADFAGKKDARGQMKTNICSKCQAWKGQLGLEPTPEFYIEHLTEAFNEVKRVLKKEGMLWLNIGDTYATTSGSQGKGDLYGKQPKFSKDADKSMPIQWKIDLPQKCLCMIPERLAWSLIQDGWILRNKIIWYKPNAMPSSVTDRFSNRYEFIYMFSQSQKYYFDLDAVREAHTTQENRPFGIARNREWGYNSKLNKIRGHKIKGDDGIKQNPQHHGQDIDYSNLGKNPGDVFEINTQPFPEAHFAVFPEKLCEKPIKAGCPEEACKKCGKARERITEKEVEFTSGSGKAGNPPKGKHENSIQSKSGNYDIRMGPQVSHKTIGWTSCDCNAGFEGGILLDPFCGAGTALYVAKEMKRRYIGIEINKEFCKMSERRLAQGVL